MNLCAGLYMMHMQGDRPVAPTAVYNITSQRNDKSSGHCKGVLTNNTMRLPRRLVESGSPRNDVYMRKTPGKSDSHAICHCETIPANREAKQSH
jgi:hypothetical protein